MSFDLETAKNRLNITDASKDDEIQLALDTALSVAENYCDRKFMFESSVVEDFIFKTNESFAVERYPIDKINSSENESGQAVTDNLYTVDQDAGLVRFAKGYPNQSFTVNYDGGYKVLPLDIELALWSIFDKIWAMTQSSTGGGVVVGGIESVAITGVGSVKYSSGSSGDDAIGSDNSLISSMAYSVLKKYVRVLA
jgi:hypothetical protein